MGGRRGRLEALAVAGGLLVAAATPAHADGGVLKEGKGRPSSSGWSSTGGHPLPAGGHPAPAGGSTPVPEPADFLLFAAGVAGLVIGRRSSRKPG